MRLAQRMAQIQPSATFAISKRAAALRAAGAAVVSFAMGEPDYDTPEHICEAAIAAIKEGFTRYTPVSGIDELKEAIIGEFQTNYGLSYDPAEVIVSCGAKHSLYNLAQVLFDPGDEVLIPVPYWVSYPEIVRLAGAVPVPVATHEENGFKLQPDALKEAITGRTRALILNSPSNPSGSVYSRGELEALASVILEYNLVVISDDIYYRIRYNDEPWCNLAMLGNELKKQTITVNGVSKTYAMTGWRIGYLAGSAQVAGAVSRIQSQSTSNPGSIAQKAAVAALKGPQDSVDRMVREYDKRRRYMVSRLDSMPDVHVHKPSGAFYVFANFAPYFGSSYNGNEIKGSVDLASYLLENAHIAVVPGVAFGEDNCLRFSYATSLSHIEQGLTRASEALSRLS
ncbi:MAG: pyridoxal phosphate-dependent aminotransferase [Syntrophobacteria bacterium]